MRNITLSAEEALIEKARRRALKERTTLNSAFRAWLKSYVRQEAPSRSYRELMAQLSYASPGRRFTREESNER